MKQKMPVFWGCTFTHNYPFLIKSTKALLDALGVEPTEVKEFGCCPDPIYIRAYGKESSLCLSARNLALAQRHGKRLLVACNGCYNVLHGAQEELENPLTRTDINSMLPEGTKYNGGLQVVHLLNLLNAKNPIIKTLVKKPLKGIKVAVHYGCHAIYPPAVSSDDPRNPRSMDDLVAVTGATSVDYESKVDCCGIPVISFDKEEGDTMLLKKLADIKKAGADCIVTACPACFMRFDMLPPELKEYTIPVLHISELLCLALGMPPESLFIECHATKTDDLMKKIGIGPSEERIRIAKCFDRSELESHCEACREECTAAVSTRNTDKPFDPIAPVDALLAGRLEEVLRGGAIWRCLQCGKCEERCPNNLGLKDFYAKLREMALAEGVIQRTVDEKVKMLEETGYGMPKRAGVRKKMGLDAAPDVDSGEIRKILDNVRSRRKK